MSSCCWDAIECLIRIGVRLCEVARGDGTSSSLRWQIQCSYVAGTTAEVPIRIGVPLWEVRNVLFVCGWNLD